jgi:6-phosphogluconolactonase
LADGADDPDLSQVKPVLHVLDDPARVVGELLAEATGRICLTGGSTPGLAYAHAAELQPDWHGRDLYWSDERCVPPDDDRSNYGLAERTLLDRLERKPAIHRIRGEAGPGVALEYELEIGDARFDLSLLGLGPDGHVASLFAGSPQLGVRDRLVTSGPPALEPFVDRITLTLPALLAAKHIVFLVTGAAKADAVQRAFRHPISDTVPASLLRNGDAPIDVYLDDAAAGSTGD